jgi:integrase/recombinase XerD
MAELSPLRRRMIEDMTIRNLSPATQRSYVHAVAKFSRHFGRSPRRLGLEDVRAFQVHLVSTGISWPALNQTVCALRFFYGVTLGHALVSDETKAASDKDCSKTLTQIQELTPIIEREINNIVMACTRARRQMLQKLDFSGPTFH